MQKFTHMDPQQQAIVDKAIADGRNVIASIETDGQTLSFSARFLKRYPDGFTCETDFLPDGSKLAAIKTGLRATFSFGMTAAAVQFQADVLSIEEGAGPAVVRCGSISELYVGQRRNHFRVAVNGSCPLEVVIWKIPQHWVLRDRPKPSAQLRVELINLSLGGMCLIVRSHRVGPADIAVGQRIRAEVTYKQEPAVLDAEVVYLSSPNEEGSVRAGIAFRKLDNTIEGRRGANLLNQAIAALERQNIKAIAAAPAA
jgi:c-di-GMP-binding flagellar brake protein YcgR